jgi:hypothetical protein
MVQCDRDRVRVIGEAVAEGGWPVADSETEHVHQQRPVAGQRGMSLCVPKTSSMSCDLGVFVDDATEAITPFDLELI